MQSVAPISLNANSVYLWLREMGGETAITRCLNGHFGHSTTSCADIQAAVNELHAAGLMAVRKAARRSGISGPLCRKAGQRCDCRRTPSRPPRPRLTAASSRPYRPCAHWDSAGAIFRGNSCRCIFMTTPTHRRKSMKRRMAFGVISASVAKPPATSLTSAHRRHIRTVADELRESPWQRSATGNGHPRNSSKSVAETVHPTWERAVPAAEWVASQKHRRLQDGEVVAVRPIHRRQRRSIWLYVAAGIAG